MQASEKGMGVTTTPTPELTTQVDFTAPDSIALEWSEPTDKSGITITHRTGTWGDLKDRLRTAGTYFSKAQCPWIKMATFGSRRTAAGSLRSNENMIAIHGIEGDYDGEVVTMQTAVDLLEKFKITAVLYPSPSNSPAAPRWRVICPLSCRHSPADRAELVARLDAVLDGILASESFTPSQSYYFGATPTNDYQVITTEGQCIDQLPAWVLPRAAIKGGKQNEDGNTRFSDTSPNASWKEIRSALERVPPDCSRDEWLRIGMALNLYGTKTSEIQLALGLWRDWSAQAQTKYKGEREIENQWSSFKANKSNSVGIATLFHIATKYGWTKSEGNASALFPNIGDAADLTQRPLMKPVNVVDVISAPSQPPLFIWDGYLPLGNVALLGAHGGTGKSTITLMLGVCAALGLPLFGVATMQCKVLFVSLEDGEHVVRHRLAGICRAWGINPEQLDKLLLIVDGTDHPELFTADTRGTGQTTPSYAEVHKLVQLEDIGLVLVDNASDAFGGDEIQRRQVRAFMRSLAEIARLTPCAVLLLAHVDKNTSRNRKGEGSEAYSGSTAWHNSARSRLFLTRAENGTLTLEHQKSNLGRMRDPLTLTWLDGGLPTLDSAIPSAERLQADFSRAVEVLRLIAEFEGRGQYCSPVATARNNVHAMLRSEPHFQKLKLTPDLTKRIVNQSQRDGWLQEIAYTNDYKTRRRWKVTELGLEKVK